MITITVYDRAVLDLIKRVGKLRVDASPVFRAMGTTLKSITEGNFSSVGSAYRPTPWPRKRDGTVSNLQQSTTLAKSFSLRVGSHYARLGNPTTYAAMHQFGGEIIPRTKPLLRFRSGGRWWSVKKVSIPARPYLPISSSGQLTAKAARLIVGAGNRALKRLADG